MSKAISPVTKDKLPKYLKLANESIYDKFRFEIGDLKMNSESVEYCACQFSMNRWTIEYRESKITPIKIGQFVTVWRRNKVGIIVPFDSLDAIDFVIIFAKNNYNSGQFIFPKSTLIEKQIVSKNGNGGKLGFRVYPPWDKPTSKQAVKTQSWQTKYFLSIERDGTSDLNLAKQLFSNTV